MNQSTTEQFRLAHWSEGTLDISFDGGRLTADGGLVWLQRVDAGLRLSRSLAAQIPEWRTGPVRHDRKTLVRQRLLQIACGYEDQNDATPLRTDPLLQLACDRLPERDPDLASQPTLSRLENAADAKGCYRLAETLLELYLTERGRLGRPTRILIDVDETNAPTHGEQEGSAYNGFQRQHMYHPLLMFDGDTNQLITAVLRPGAAHDSSGLLGILRRLVRAIRRRWPGIAIDLRADTGFAIPALYAYCEQHELSYTIGFGPNSRLDKAAADLLTRAQRQQAETGANKVRLISELNYQAHSWDQPRRAIYKAEALPDGPNTRFVVTNRPEHARRLYDWYVARGEVENWIKDFKRACAATRLSCHRFWANQFRLLLHAACFWILDTLRRWLQHFTTERLQLDTLRLRVIKIGAWVCRLRRRIRLRLATSHPSEPLWRLLNTTLSPPMNNPG